MMTLNVDRVMKSYKAALALPLKPEILSVLERLEQRSSRYCSIHLEILKIFGFPTENAPNHKDSHENPDLELALNRIVSAHNSVIGATRGLLKFRQDLSATLEPIHEITTGLLAVNQEIKALREKLRNGNQRA